MPTMALKMGWEIVGDRKMVIAAFGQDAGQIWHLWKPNEVTPLTMLFPTGLTRSRRPSLGYVTQWKEGEDILDP